MNWGTFGDPDVFYAMGANGKRYRVKANKHGGLYWYADEWTPDMKECTAMFRKGTREECFAWAERQGEERGEIGTRTPDSSDSPI